LLKHNEQVILVEKNSILGGTSTIGGVNTWEPGVGGNGVHHRLSKTLLLNKQAGVGKTIGKVCKETPYSYSKIFETEIYESTLKRSGLNKNDRRRFQFEPYEMANVMYKMLKSYQNLVIMFNTELIAATAEKEKVRSIIVKNLIDNTQYEIEAQYYIDCTGDIVLARKVSCEYTIGEESKDAYNELLAPMKPSNNVNSVSQIIRITKTNSKRKYKMPMEYINENTKKWLDNIYSYKIVSVINEYPNGDLNVNLLPTMDGREYLDIAKEDRKYYLISRMYAYFEFLSNQIGFEQYKISHIFKMIGVRETYRLVGQYVLTEMDVVNNKIDKDIICYADHAIDIHGKSNINSKGTIEVKTPYAIPKQCIQPKEYSNLLVASRGSSFSHIAASSCRLSRTMLALGEGAGNLIYEMYINSDKKNNH